VAVFFFDLDNTLYAERIGVVARIDRRINEYLEVHLGIPAAEVDGVRRQFWAEHGTTLRGLMSRHSVDADDYLQYVHDIDLGDLLAPNQRLRTLLARLPGRKAVFSNASRAHARRVLDLLGLDGAFEAVIGLEDLDYVPKPQPQAFRIALDRLGAAAHASTLIDDLRANLRAAKQLGMRTVWVASDGEPADATIDHVVAHVFEIERIFCAAAPSSASSASSASSD
jgi:putative hydrolase of the HAD superfamily